MSGTGIIGVKGGNVIVSAPSLIKQTKEYTLTVTSGNAGWSTTRAVGIAYADSTGVWRLRFNVYGTFNQSAAVNFTIANITTAAVRQAVAIYMEEVSTATRQNTGGFIEASSSVVYGATPGVNSTMITASGDVELASKPSWADANMEGVMPIVAYIPFGQAGMPGEVFGTLRSGTNGSSYSTRSTTAPSDTSGTYTNLISITLNKGTYLISYKGSLRQDTGGRRLIHYLAVGGTAVTDPGALQSIEANVGSGVIIPAVPVIITVDSTAVAVRATWDNNVSGSSENLNEMWAIRLTP